MQKTLIKDELATLRTLKRARRLIARPENWCQGPAAVDADGYSVDATSERACAFCTVGSVRHVAGYSKADQLAYEALSQTTMRMKHPDMPGAYNDKPGRQHGEVLRVFDRTIRTVERRIKRMRARRARG